MLLKESVRVIVHLLKIKIVRFADKERHQLFLEPEGRNTEEVYVQGLSTSLPEDVQRDLVHSIKGLENAEMIENGLCDLSMIWSFHINCEQH